MGIPDDVRLDIWVMEWLMSPIAEFQLKLSSLYSLSLGKGINTLPFSPAVRKTFMTKSVLYVK